MNNRISAFFLALWASAASGASAQPVQEIWSGVYRCGAMQTASGQSPAYTSSIRMLVDGRSALIVKQSSDITERLSGELRGDGTLRLDGTGTRRDGGSSWRYRYDGRFTGDRFDARGTMLSGNTATRLRDCSMTLTRMHSADRPSQSRVAAAPAAAPAAPPAPAREVQSQADSRVAPAKAPTEPPAAPEATAPREARRAPKPVPAVEGVMKALDFSEGNDAATVQGTVEHGMPHRYSVIAREGQRLVATLKGDAGARFDLYEPGSTLSMLSSGFVVQGARVAPNDEGRRVDATLTADGTYLLLVRAGQTPAFYTLEIAVAEGAPGGWRRWKNDRRAWAAAAVAALVVLMLLMRVRRRDRRMFRPD